MKQSGRCGCLFLMTIAALLACPAFAVADGVFLVGAAEADITPVVSAYEDVDGNGRFDMGDPSRPFGFGDRVTAFKEGEVRIGNGRGTALYVYDPIGVRALVIEDPNTGRRVGLVTADLYMVMNSEVRAIRRALDPSLRIGLLVVAATHTHMGPDTLGLSSLVNAGIGDVLKIAWWSGPPKSGVNGVWMEKFIQTAADTVARAASSMQPARLRFATTEFDFGVRDMREPLIIDRDLVVMAAEGLDGTPIATLVQWACHPEAVLNYGSEQYGLDPASMTETEREPWGRVMSAGFPGYFAREMKRLRGGVPLYFNGPLGGMITNLDGVLWDPDAHPEFPTTADPSTVPEQIRIPNDFRYAAVQGRELARAAAVALEASGKTAVETTVDYSRAEFLMPLENPLFRAGAALGFMGYYPRHLYDERGRRDMRTAPWVGGLLVPALDVPQGKFLRSEVSVVRIGPAQIANVPTEALPEFTVGLPPDFATDTVKYFPQNAGAHATGEAYRMIHPALKDQMDAEFKMVFCLSGDDLGYLIPEADFRPSHDIPIPPLSWWWVTSDAVADPHYEESMTVSSRIEPAIMGALTTLLSGKDTGP